MSHRTSHPQPEPIVQILEHHSQKTVEDAHGWFTTAEAFKFLGGIPGTPGSKVSTLDEKRSIGYDMFRRLKPHQFREFGLESQQVERTGKNWTMLRPITLE